MVAGPVTMGSASSGSLEAALAWINGVVLGSVGNAVAVAAIGLAMLFGRIGRRSYPWMRVGGAALAAVLASPGPALAEPGLDPACIGKAYVSNSTSETLSIVDVRTNQVLTTLPIGDGTVNPTFTPDGKHVYVSSSAGDSIFIIDVATNTINSVLRTRVPKPSGLAFTPDGRKLVLTFLGSTPQDKGAIGVINVADGRLSGVVTLQGQPERLALTPDGKRAYAVNIHGNSVSVYDVDRHQLLTTIPIGGTLPFNILMAKDGRHAYVGVHRSDAIAVIDTTTNEVLKHIPTGKGTNGMAFSPDGKDIWVTNARDNSLQVIFDRGRQGNGDQVCRRISGFP